MLGLGRVEAVLKVAPLVRNPRLPQTSRQVPLPFHRVEDPGFGLVEAEQVADEEARAVAAISRVAIRSATGGRVHARKGWDGAFGLRGLGQDEASRLTFGLRRGVNSLVFGPRVIVLLCLVPAAPHAFRREGGPGFFAPLRSPGPPPGENENQHGRMAVTRKG